MYLIYNGNTTEEENFKIGFNNRAFNYGDGVFETIIADQNKVYYLSDHIERLNAGIKSLGMNTPLEINLNTIENYVIQLIQLNKINDLSRIKIIVWRKPGGLFSPSDNNAEFIISATTHNSNNHAKSNVFFFNNIKLSYSTISRYKTLSSLPYVMAGIAKNSLQADDLILLDTNNNIAECIASNIFWIKDNVIFTPSLETGCKEGIIRKQIIRYLNKNNIQWHEGKYQKDHLMNADMIFNCNVAGIIPIFKVEDKNFSSTNDLFLKIQKELSV